MIMQYNLSCFVGKVILNDASFEVIILLLWGERISQSAAQAIITVVKRVKFNQSKSWRHLWHTHPASPALRNEWECEKVSYLGICVLAVWVWSTAAPCTQSTQYT